MKKEVSLISRTMLLLICIAFLPVPSDIDHDLNETADEEKPSIAKLIIDKGLAKINSDVRKNVTVDINSVDEKYTNKQALIDGRLKSRQERKKTITGRPSLGSMDVDKLYNTFTINFDFFIDNNDSIGIINGVRYGLIKFNPKPNLTSNTVTDAFINHTTGKVYINIDNYEIVRIEGGINSHFLTTWKAWWSPISFDIDVYEFSFSIDYTLFNNMVIEKSLVGMVDYEIRNRGVEKYIYTLSNYRMRR